jgi:hypothetical protein
MHPPAGTYHAPLAPPHRDDDDDDDADMVLVRNLVFPSSISTWKPTSSASYSQKLNRISFTGNR